MSIPFPPDSVSFPAPPSIKSTPSIPEMLSVPAKPNIMLLADDPTSTSVPTKFVPYIFSMLMKVSPTASPPETAPVVRLTLTTAAELKYATVSEPIPPFSTSPPAPPINTSSPSLPLMLSTPAPPLRLLAWPSPTIVSAWPEPMTYSTETKVSPAASPPESTPVPKLMFTPTVEAE